MRSGAWLWAVLLPTAALFSGGCSGGYPLEPTRCDDWCEATHGPRECYQEYDPAGCVTQCETLQLDHEKCRSQFDAALSCYRTNPGAREPLCYYDYNPNAAPPSRPCDTERQQLTYCVGVELTIQDIGREPNL